MSSAKPNSNRKPFIVGGSIVLGVAVFIAILLVIFNLSNIFEALQRPGYGDAVKDVHSAQKQFTADETIEIGPYDMKIVGVDTNAKLTDVEYTRAVAGKHFVRVSATLHYNEQRDTKTYAQIVGDDWLNGTSGYNGIGDMRLNGVQAVGNTFYPSSKLDEAREQAKTTEGYPVTFLYQINTNSDPLTLAVGISIFSKISLLVGSEGMPREDLTYTVQLN